MSIFPRKLLLGIFVGVVAGCIFAHHSLTCCPSQWLRTRLSEIGGYALREGIDTEGGGFAEVAKNGTRNAEQRFSIGNSTMNTTEACGNYFEIRPGTEFYLQGGSQTRFVILSMARSESHFLLSLLGHHPAILMNYEAFSPVAVWAVGWNHTLKGKRDYDRNKFVNLLFDPANPRYGRRNSSAKAFGFKLAPKHVTAEEFRSLAEASNIKKIVLRRKQTLRQFVSDLKAQQKQKWAHTNTTGVKVHVNVNRYKYFASWQRGFYDNCIHHHVVQGSLAERSNWFFVDFEALTEDTVRTVNNVCSFLGVERIGHKLRASTTKQDASPVSDSILNFAELRLAFANDTLELDH